MQLYLIEQIRILALAFRGFKEDEVLVRSSALTFYTLLSVVPIIAMAFGIAKGFGFEEMLNDQIQSYFSSQPEISKMLLQFSHSSLENTKGGLIAGLGVVMLFWSVMKVLGNIELSFNAVWGIKTPRTLIKKITEYIAIMLIAPVLVILSSAVTIFVSSAATHVLSEDNSFYLLGPAFKILIKLIPYVLIWILFTFIYLAIPNTKVKFKHALAAGIIAGSSFNFLEWAYFTFQFGAVQYGAVYGSFAALPLFLVWVQSSWIVVLFGCEIAFSGQHADRFIYEEEVTSISLTYRKKMSLLLLLKINTNFNRGLPPLSAATLCAKTGLPIRLVQLIINDLKEANIITDTTLKEQETLGYTPFRSINELTVSDLIKTLNDQGNHRIPTRNKREADEIKRVMDQLEESSFKSSSNVTLKEVQNKLSL